jgi:hypothetical protein
VNPERLIVGFATVYDEPSVDGTAMHHAEQFERFLQDPLLLGYPNILLFHRDPLTARERMGYWYAFRSVAGVDGRPAGLLALGLLGESPSAKSVAEEVGKDVTKWALSIGAKDVSDAEDGSQLWLSETTIARRLQPGERLQSGVHTAFDRAAVLRVGETSADAWCEVTGEPRMPLPPDRPTQTVYGQWIQTTAGTLVREQWQEPI